jgi:CubicO group peptidase (beta-lactamase class C family)
MNSGFEPMQFPKNPFSRHVRRQIGTDLAKVALEFPLVDEPGAVFNYNGLNPTLLVMILERATGRRYADYLSEKLWRLLGNRDAAVWLDHPGGLARGATSLYAVPRDWLRIGELLLNRGRVGTLQIVPEAWIDEMITPSATNPLYGFLIWIGSRYTERRSLDAFKGFSAHAGEPFLASDIIYLDGLGGQRVYIIPSQKLVIVRTGVLAMEWEESTLPNTILSGLKN